MNRSGPVDAVPAGALPHGTTIVALKFPGGVVMAGDRRSTQGNMIAGRDVQKVYITDDYTATGIAGTAAIAVEFARLYAVELEHYEKTRRRAADVPRQGEPAGDHGARQSRRGAAGLRRAAAAGGLRPRRPEPAGRGPHRVVRRRRRLEHRGRGLPVGGLRLDLRQVVDQEAVLAGGRRRFGAAGGGRGALRRRRRRLRDRRTGPGAWHLSDRGDHRRRRRRGRGRGAHRGTGPRGHRKPFSRKTLSVPTCAQSHDARGDS